MAENQFSLLRQRRFGPLFITQFLGAFNDNVYRNALITLITFQLVGMTDGDINAMINLCAALFILPFFLFSASAGQIADKHEKSFLIRRIKLLEVIIMLGACVALYFDTLYGLVGVLFMMGFQSSLFGPIKYGILPQHLADRELVGGNGMIEMGTYLAILLGLMVGGNLMAIEYGRLLVALIVVTVAVCGYLASRRIPEAPAVAPDLKIDWNPFSATVRMVRVSRKNLVVFRSILGISWFWLLGSVYLTQLPNYARLNLGGDEGVFTALLALFSLGIGVGSLACEKLSSERVEIALVPIGAIGLTVFGIDLFFASPIASGGPLMGLASVAQQPGTWRIAMDILLIGGFGGFFIVPLYALIQQRSERSQRSRIIAANNIINALFMVLSALISIALLSAGLSIPQLFLAAAVMNVAVATYIFTLVPEFLLRFLVWILIHMVYRVDKRGLGQIPQNGSAVLVCNHVSFVDALIIAGCISRPTRFVMDHRIFKTPGLSFLFRTAGAIPIASAKDKPGMLDAAFERISEYLNDDELVCIFPEGKITRDGELNTFRPGVERIVDVDPTVVVPMALRGLWGSYYSRKAGRAMSKPTWSLRRPIELVAGAPIPAEQVSAERLQQAVAELRGERR